MHLAVTFRLQVYIFVGSKYTDKLKLFIQQKLARSRALKPDLIRLFFHPEQYFSLINSSSIPPNHPDSSRIQTNEQAQYHHHA